MDTIIKQRSQLSGTVELPGDHYLSQLVAILGAIAVGNSELYNFSMTRDCISLINCLRSLGVQFDTSTAERVLIIGRGPHLGLPAKHLDVGTSLTGLQLILPLVASQCFESNITADATIRNTDLSEISKPLTEMGALVKGRGVSCLPPVIARGDRLQPITYHTRHARGVGRTAVLLAGAMTSGITTIKDPVPVIDHTERMLSYFGAEFFGTFPVISLRGPASLTGKKVCLPGDHSLATFLAVGAAALPGSELIITGLCIDSLCLKSLEVLQKMGAQVTRRYEHEESGFNLADIIIQGGELKGITVEADDIPFVVDDLPALMVAGAFAQGQTAFEHLDLLNPFEMSRVKKLGNELTKLGAQVQFLEGVILIQGKQDLKGTECDTTGDGWIGLALLIAGALASGETLLHRSESLEHCFPGWENQWRNLEKSAE